MRVNLTPGRGAALSSLHRDALVSGLRKQARAAGRENLPASNATEPTRVEADTIRQFERFHRECAEPARVALHVLTARFAAVEASLPGERDLAERVVQVAGDLDREVGTASALAILWVERERKFRDLRVFVRDEGLARDARYPASRWLHLGLVAVLLLIESWANARFFSEASDFGLLGGFLGAFCVAAVNVGSGFATGWLVLPWLSYRSAVARACFSVAVLCMVAFAGALNVAAAAYRDQLAAGAVGTASLHELLRDPFGLSFVSAALLATGLLAWGIALWKGYTFDDGYPFYGRLDRRFRDSDRAFLIARDEFTARVVARVQCLSADLRVELDRGIAKLAHLDAIVVEAGCVSDEYETDRADLRAHCTVLLKTWREENCFVRTDLPPAYFAEYPPFASLVPEEVLGSLAERTARARALHTDLEARAHAIVLENEGRVAAALSRVQAYVADVTQHAQRGEGVST